MLVSNSVSTCKLYLKSKCVDNWKLFRNFHYRKKVVISQVETKGAKIFKSIEAKTSRKHRNGVWKRKTYRQKQKRRIKKIVSTQKY